MMVVILMEMSPRECTHYVHGSFSAAAVVEVEGELP